jgi:tRNA threonylcarbamoyl adenosine modification protein YjeE
MLCGIKNEMKIPVFTLSQLQDLAKELADRIESPACVALWGDMGAGKTTFSKAFVRALLNNSKAEVPSPTFTLVQIYPTDKGEIWHCDLYRLHDPEETLELGLLEAFQKAICLIEWPDRLGNLLPTKRIDIFLDIIDENHRSLVIEERYES